MPSCVFFHLLSRDAACAMMQVARAGGGHRARRWTESEPRAGALRVGSQQSGEIGATQGWWCLRTQGFFAGFYCPSSTVVQCQWLYPQIFLGGMSRVGSVFVSPFFFSWHDARLFVVLTSVKPKNLLTWTLRKAPERDVCMPSPAKFGVVLEC